MFSNKTIQKSAFVIFLLTAIVVVILFWRSQTVTKTVNKQVNLSPAPALKIIPNTDLKSWVQYKDKDYPISISHPDGLQENITKNQGGYLKFIRFVERSTSEGKGVVLGISTDSLKAEVLKIKTEMAKSGEAVLKEEKNTLVSGGEGVYLSYEPKNKEYDEDKVVIIFKSGKYTYSVSTVPQQIDNVVASVRLL